MVLVIMSAIFLLVEVLVALFIMFRLGKKTSIHHRLRPKEPLPPHLPPRTQKSAKPISTSESPRAEVILSHLRRTRLHLYHYRDAHITLLESLEDQTECISVLQDRIARRDEFTTKAEETYAEVLSAYEETNAINEFQAEDLAVLRKYAQDAFEQHNALVDKYDLLVKSKMVSDEEVKAQRQENEEMKERMKDESSSLRELMSEMARLRNQNSELERVKTNQDAVVAHIWNEKIEIERELNELKGMLGHQTPRASTFDSGLMDAEEEEENWSDAPEPDEQAVGANLADELGSDNEDENLMTFN